MLIAGDGPALGAVLGTNTSFSAAHNICPLCEDAYRAKMRVPNAFLTCDCADTSRHVSGCVCRFQLRTPEADLARGDDLPAETLRRLGIVTERHGFLRIPEFHVAHMHVRDAMHTFLEGITRMLGAYTLCMMVKCRWCTPAELRRALLQFPFPVKDRPGFLPAKLFKLTKIARMVNDGRGSKTMKGVNKDVKLPYTAYITLIFTVFSTEFLREFVPSSKPNPAWWSCWLVHVSIVRSMLKFSFTFDDLILLEKLSLKCQELFFSVDEYSHLWKPKWHWATHLAHDIFKYGPPRMLWCMIMEMKNREFKLACKRSNYHNPVKSTAEFWVHQSGYVLRNRKHAIAPDSDGARTIGLWTSTGDDNEDDTPLEIQLLIRSQQLRLQPSGSQPRVEYVSSVRLHGVLFCQNELVMLGSTDSQLCRIVHIMRAVLQADLTTTHYFYLDQFDTMLQGDADGGLKVDLSSLQQPVGHRLISIGHVPIVAMWDFVDEMNDSVHLVCKW